MYIHRFFYLGFYVAFNTVQVISRRVVGRAEETSTYSSLGFCTINCRPTASNYQLSHLRPWRGSNPGRRGGRRECYNSATVAPCTCIEDFRLWCILIWTNLVLVKFLFLGSGFHIFISIVTLIVEIKITCLMLVIGVLTKVKVSPARLKVISRPHHDVTYWHTSTIVPTKHQLPTLKYFWNDFSWCLTTTYHGWKQ